MTEPDMLTYRVLAGRKTRMLNQTTTKTLNGLIVKPSATAFWLGFAWAMFAMLVSRYWIVPNFIASQDGHILGDPVFYHDLALEQVEIIRQQGWGAFELHFAKQGTAGVTSLLYMVYPSPFLVVVLNALLHGVACAAVARLLSVWFSPTVSLLATVPLILSIVYIFWLAQINKESYVIAGCALFFLGYLLSLKDIYAGKVGAIWIVVALVGIVLIYIPRPHMNQMLMLGFLFASIFVIGLALATKRLKAASLALLQAAIIGIAFGYFSQGGLSDTVDQMIAKAADPKYQFVQPPSDPTITLEGKTSISPASTEQSSQPQDTVRAEAHNEARTEPPTESPTEPLSDPIKEPLADSITEPLGLICYRKLDPETWQTVNWLPAAINVRIKALADLRCHNHELHDVQDNAMTKQSIADADVAIEGVIDMIAYAPRGLQLGFFGPLPSQWPDGSFLKSFFYTAVPVMMVFFYIAMAFAAIWIVRNKAWLALPLFAISIIPLWILGISTSFFGSLFRYRYPIWIILLCFGAATLLAMTVFRNQQPKNKAESAS